MSCRPNGNKIAGLLSIAVFSLFVVVITLVIWLNTDKNGEKNLQPDARVKMPTIYSGVVVKLPDKIDDVRGYTHIGQLGVSVLRYGEPYLYFDVLVSTDYAMRPVGLNDTVFFCVRRVSQGYYQSSYNSNFETIEIGALLQKDEADDLIARGATLFGK